MKVLNHICAVAFLAASYEGGAERPNVLFIALDDLNDSVG